MCLCVQDYGRLGFKAADLVIMAVSYGWVGGIRLAQRPKPSGCSCCPVLVFWSSCRHCWDDWAGVQYLGTNHIPAVSRSRPASTLSFPSLLLLPPSLKTHSFHKSADIFASGGLRVQEVGAILVIAVLNGVFLRKHYEVVLFNEATTLLTSQFPHIPDADCSSAGCCDLSAKRKEVLWLQNAAACYSC